jgi:peptide alpha-N-acetyltransferase
MSALVINKDGKENEKGKNPLAANEEIEYVDYEDERMLDDIQILVSKDLSEPYSVFTYRYFVHNWPNLSICVYAKNKETNERKMIGTIVCKADTEFGYMAGYIAMLTVDKEYRHFGIGSKLVNMGLERMVEMGCLEIILETEVRHIHFSPRIFFPDIFSTSNRLPMKQH